MRFRGRPARFALFIGLGSIVATRWWLTAVSQPHNLAEGAYRVDRVLSGDRLELSNQTRIRLLGIRAPDRTPSTFVANSELPASDSSAAIEFARQFLTGGEVRLQFDRTCIDSRGELLAYVWVDDTRGGKRLLNEELVRAGVMWFDPKSRCSAPMKRRLARAAEDAQRAGRGLWASAN